MEQQAFSSDLLRVQMVGNMSDAAGELFAHD